MRKFFGNRWNNKYICSFTDFIFFFVEMKFYSGSRKIKPRSGDIKSIRSGYGIPFLITGFAFQTVVSGFLHSKINIGLSIDNFKGKKLCRCFIPIFLFFIPSQEIYCCVNFSNVHLFFFSIKSFNSILEILVHSNEIAIRLKNQSKIPHQNFYLCCFLYSSISSIKYSDLRLIPIGVPLYFRNKSYFRFSIFVKSSSIFFNHLTLKAISPVIHWIAKDLISKSSRSEWLP